MDSEQLTKIKNEIDAIKARNKRVEIDKAWETSLFRKVSITIITYMFMTGLFLVLGVDKPYLNSLVPTFGYLLSTLTLSLLKDIWVKAKKK